ncbi:MAG: hypothetical protein AAGN82_15780 [Myxococcota bacterium]
MLRRCLDAAARGVMGPCLEGLGQARDGERLSLALAAWLAGCGAQTAPDIDAVAAQLGQGPPAEQILAAQALPLLSRARWLALDVEGVTAVAALGRSHEAVAREAGVDVERLTLRAGVFQQAVSADAASALETRGRSAGRADVVVEAAALGALARAASGEVQPALELARRAVRMARAEGLRQEQYFAGLVLAHIRRSLGQTHLASHILTTLGRVASNPWQPWIGWELALASCIADAAPAASPGPWLVELARAREQNNDATAADRIARLDRCFAVPSLLASDWRCARGLLDPQGADDDDAAVQAFRAGRAHVVPRGMGHLLADEPPVAYAVMGRAPARVGARPLGRTFPAERIFERTQRQQRIFTLLSVVGLAGAEGIDEDKAFRETYGFRYDRDVHREVFNVLCHRARGVLGDRGALHRTGGRMRLTTDSPLAVPDPRCEQPLDNRVLALVSRRGAMGARDISKSLGVSLRATQKALETLVGDGACQRVKAGRAVSYAVEDTTFSEPTVPGAAAPPA